MRPSLLYCGHCGSHGRRVLFIGYWLCKECGVLDGYSPAKRDRKRPEGPKNKGISREGWRSSSGALLNHVCSCGVWITRYGAAFDGSSHEYCAARRKLTSEELERALFHVKQL